MPYDYQSALTYDCVRCAECGRVVAGRIPGSSTREPGDGSVLMPRRHKPPAGIETREAFINDADSYEWALGECPRTYRGGWCWGYKLEADDAPRSERVRR